MRRAARHEELTSTSSLGGAGGGVGRGEDFLLPAAMVEGRIGLGATSGGSAGKGGSTATPRLSGLVPPRPMACVSGLSPGACAFSSGSSNCSGCTPAVQTDRWIQHIPYMIIIHLPAG